MKQKLAIIGANESITMLIDKAKALGYETHVFAWRCGDPGEKAADCFYPISISEKEAILEKCKEIGICGICSITSDFAAPTVAYVARKLGLPGNPERTDVVARNKYEMRKAFREYGGIYCPKFVKTDEFFNRNIIKDFSFPVIVKPTDGWSSKGITRVDQINDIEKAISYAISQSLEKKAIIEEFIEGPEYSAECIVQNGEATILAFTQKETTGYPHYIETGHIQPSNIPLEMQDGIKDVIKRALKALDITNSAAHAEFRIMNNGNIGIMEIGARMGGDCIGTDLTPLSTGIDYVRMVIDVACGNPISFETKSTPCNAKVSFVISKSDLQTFYDIKRNNPDCIVRYSISDLNFDTEVRDSSTRHGYYILKQDGNAQK